MQKSSSIKVAVRVRPFNEHELNQECDCIIRMDGNETMISRPGNYSLLDSKEHEKKFIYDYSYWSLDNSNPLNYATQATIYEDLGNREVIAYAYEGYNVCLFAYGQTGSGKSYTMMGSNKNDNEEGLIPRICRKLYDTAKNSSNLIEFNVEISYFEIYNEKVRDLLKNDSSSSNLRIREHPREGPFIVDLSKHLITDYDDLKDLIIKGNLNRTIASTEMNETSSRSHSIFTIKFLKKSLNDQTTSKIHLVDLAGSERASTNFLNNNDNANSNLRFKEGSNINKSLLTLMNVISTLSNLSDDKQLSLQPKKLYIPYRDSVLTWLLKDSLGGNSKTIMIATISPSSLNYYETLSTLRYAQRAKLIINKPKINEDESSTRIRELNNEIENLKKQLSINNFTSELINSCCEFNEFHTRVSLKKFESQSFSYLCKMKEPFIIGLSNTCVKFIIIDSERTSIKIDEKDDDDGLQKDDGIIYRDENKENFYLSVRDSTNCAINGYKLYENEKAYLKSGDFISFENENEFFYFFNPMKPLLGSRVYDIYNENHEANRTTQVRYDLEKLLNTQLILTQYDRIIKEKSLDICNLNQTIIEYEAYNEKLNQKELEIEQSQKTLKDQHFLLEQQKQDLSEEKYRLEEERLLFDWVSNLNKYDFNILQEKLNDYKSIKKSIDQLKKQINQEKDNIDKELKEKIETKNGQLSNCDGLRKLLINDPNLIELKLKISNLCEQESQINNSIGQILEKIKEEKNDLEQLVYLRDQKEKSLLNDGLTLSEAMKAEEDNILDETDILDALKREKNETYNLIEKEIQAVLDKMKFESNLETKELSQLIEKLGKIEFVLQSEITKEEQILLLEEAQLIKNEIDEKESIIKKLEKESQNFMNNEFKGLNDLKQRDLEEIKFDEERLNSLIENSLKNQSKLIDFKRNNLRSSEEQLIVKYNLLKENTFLMENLLFELETFEKQKFIEEDKIYQIEMKINSEFNDKSNELNKILIEIEKEFENKLEKLYVRKEFIKDEIQNLIGTKLSFLDFDEKLNQLEEKILNKIRSLSILSRNDSLLLFNNNQQFQMIINPQLINKLGISISITGYYLVKKLMSEFNVYDVQIKLERSLNEWSISRRYSEFRELHKSMAKKYSCLKRITFPLKQLLNNKNEVFLNERKLQLEYYLRCFFELLVNESDCKLNKFVLDNDLVITKRDICDICSFFQD